MKFLKEYAPQFLLTALACAVGAVLIAPALVALKAKLMPAKA